MKLKDYSLIHLGAFTVALYLLATSLIATSPRGAETTTLEMTPELELGKAIYEMYCVGCHGLNAAGTAQGPTFLHKLYHPGHHGDKAFLLAPMNGVKAHHWSFGDMPPIEGVSETELLLIRDYIRALQKANGIY